MKVRKLFFTFLLITMPFFLLMESVLIVFNPWYLGFEYNLSNFPEDPYGFSKAERLDYGSKSLLYITRNYSDSFMEELSLSDGSPLYNERELSHMSDVQEVFQKAKLAWLCLIILYLGLFFLIAKHPDSLPAFCTALKRGSIFTLLLMAVIFLLTIFAFDAMFEAFHGLFFNGNSWLFFADDSLIRLYPEKLWVDAFAICGGLTAFFSLLIFFIANKQYRKFQK